MASGKYDSRYSFQSSDSHGSADWKRRHGDGSPLKLTVGEQRLAAALHVPQQDDKPGEGKPGQAPAPPAFVALSRVVLPARAEPDEDGLRDCARGTWCASSRNVTEAGETRRVPDRAYQPYCPRDRRLLETDLSQMPAQFVHLAAEIGNPAKDGQMIRVPFGPRIPIRVDIDALMRAVVESLSSWHERVADRDRLSYPSAGSSRLQRQMVAVKNARDVLVHRVDAMLALDAQPAGRTKKVITERDPKGKSTEDVYEFEDLDGTDAGMEVFTLRYLCRAVLGETNARPEELLGVPCRRGECDQLALRRAELPSDPKAPGWWSECSACGDRLTEEEYREWVGLCAAFERNRRKVPATLENLPGVA